MTYHTCSTAGEVSSGQGKKGNSTASVHSGVICSAESGSGCTSRESISVLGTGCGDGGSGTGEGSVSVGSVDYWSISDVAASGSDSTESGGNCDGSNCSDRFLLEIVVVSIKEWDMW